MAKTSPASSPAKTKPPSKQTTQITSAHWQGPLPPPESVAKFDSIVQGGAERIFRMAELEQRHRVDSERAVISANIKAQEEEARAIKRGHYLGSAVSVLSILSSVAAVYLGAHWSVSVALVGLPIASVINTIVKNR